MGSWTVTLPCSIASVASRCERVPHLRTYVSSRIGMAMCARWRGKTSRYAHSFADILLSTSVYRLLSSSSALLRAARRESRAKGNQQ